MPCSKRPMSCLKETFPVSLEILSSSERFVLCVVMQLFGLRVATSLVAMVSMLKLERGRRDGCAEESKCGVHDETSDTNLGRDARSGCPAMPCPYCVLELDHLATHEAVIGRWRRLESQFFTSGGSHQVHLMRAAAVAWVDEAVRSDHEVSSRESWARVGRLEPATHAHAVCQRLVSTVPRTAIYLEGFFWGGEGPSPVSRSISACGPSRPREVTSLESASSGCDAAACPPWRLDEPSDPDAVAWFYYRSGKKMNQWSLYDDTSQVILRRIWNDDRGNAYLDLDGWCYEIDLQAMTQTPLGSGTLRGVKVEYHLGTPG